MRALALFLVLCVSGYDCSFIFNDTTLVSLPPLNGLDEWAKCRAQAQGDVYCAVEGELTSREPSPMLEKLKEFSQLTTKHYNRSRIRRGMCVSRCGARAAGAEPWRDAAKACLNQEMEQYGLQAEVLSVKLCTGSERAEGSASARAFAIFVVVMVSLVVLATILHVLGDRCAHVEGNKYLLAFSLKRNWEILTYDRNKPRTDQRMKDLTAIEGIRVLGVQSVIVSHVILWGSTAYTSNPHYFEKLFDTFGWQLTMNTPLWLQVFFSMSAFLTTYCALILADTSPLTLGKCFISLVNRYIRLTPAAGVAIWFVMTWFPLLGAGPQWEAAREADDCSRRWWLHLLYAQNHLPTGEVCMGQTWYLAADMQLHAVGLLTLLVLLRWRRAVVPTLTLMWAGSALVAGIVSYCYNIRPIITGQAPETLRSLFLHSKELTMLYMPIWMNLAGYAGGMATAFLYHRIQVEGVKLNQKKWFNTVFHLTLPLSTCVVAAGTVFLWDEPPPQWAASLYSALDRPLLALFFNIFLLGCFTKCKSGLRSMLEWRGFHFLGRVSYSVFLLHNVVLTLATSGNTQLVHMSMNVIISRIISTTVLSYIAAIPFCLVFELPPLQLWKAFFEGDRREPQRPQEVTPHQPSPVKPLDLVANIQRRQNVC